MRKIRLALVLPALQVMLAIVLLNWGQSFSARFGLFDSPVGDLSSLCYAMNAPGNVLLDIEIHLGPLGWMPKKLLGVRPDYFLFLLGVVLLWYVVGWELDKRNRSSDQSDRKLTPADFAAYFFLLLWGIRLSFVAWSAFAMAGWRGHVLNGIIIAFWSSALIFVSSRKFATMTRAART